MSENSTTICIWQRQGGVGKTTTTFALAYTLVQEHQKTVLMVDADPQRSLTQHALSRAARNFPNLSAYLRHLVAPRPQFNTLFHSLNNVRAGGELLPLDTVCLAHTQGGGRLLLAPGHLDLGLYDGYLHSAEDMSVHQPALLNLVGAVPHVIRKAAQTSGSELILIDLGPNTGALNRTLLMTADYFLLASCPDDFSCEATNAVSHSIVDVWIPRIRTIWPRTKACLYPIDVRRRAKLLGCIVNRYHATRVGQVQNGVAQDEMARNIMRAHDAVVRATDSLRQRLEDQGMAISIRRYEQLSLGIVLGCVRDYCTLGALSLCSNVPVPYLTPEEMQRSHAGPGKLRGWELETNAQRVTDFHIIYTATVRSLLNLLRADQD